MLVKFKKRLYPSGNKPEADTYTIALYDEVDEKGNKADVLTIVGYGLPEAKDITFEIDGEWVHHKQYGKQLKLISYREVIRPNKAGIISYLKSGQITGIGPELAERIYSQFGDQALNVLDQNPEKLRDVKGVGEKKLEKIIDSYMKNRSARDLIAFLSQYGVSPRRALSLFKIYKANALEVIRQNPYRLCENAGIGFKTADQIAMNLGISMDDPARIKEGLLYVLQEAEQRGNMCMIGSEMIDEALKLLKSDLVSREKVRAVASDLVRWGIIRLYGMCAYRAFTAIEEDKLAKCIARFIRRQKGEISPEYIDRLIDEEEVNQGFKLAFEQRQAVKVALSSGFSIITGGPGTGKTTIQKFLLNIYRRCHKDELIECAAPTGKAARRMEQTTGFESSTIHKLLNLSANEEGYTEPRSLESRFLLIDEFSMCDNFLALQLFSSVHPECQIVLIGDADQLPSVGSGSILRDLISCGLIPVVTLDKVYRQSAGSRIALNARLIRHGNYTLDYGEDFKFYDCDNIADAQRKLIDLYLSEAKKYGIDEVVILTPMRRRTITGVNDLNPIIRDCVNPASNMKKEVSYGQRVFREGDKVMMTKNADFINNGDLGYITAIFQSEEKTEVAVTFEDGRSKVYQREDLSDLDLGYVCTVHKSQGSEYKSCIVAVQLAHQIMLNRPLIYTAITRAKESVKLVGDRRALGMAVRKEDTAVRLTNLSQKICEIIKENPHEIRGLRSGS